MAVAVSEGEDGYSTRVIEVDDFTGHLIGQAISPGSDQDQSTGIYATMLTLVKICQFFNITEGSIEF